MSDKLKNMYVALLETHNWNFENHDDSKYDEGNEEKMHLRSSISIVQNIYTKIQQITESELHGMN